MQAPMPFSKCLCRCTCAIEATVKSRIRNAPSIASKYHQDRSMSSQSVRFLTAFASRTYPRQATPFTSSRLDSQSSDASIDAELQAPEVPWYINEAPASSSGKTANARESPTPPSTIPEQLHPLWDYLFTSPFFQYDAIRFIKTDVTDSLGDPSIPNEDLDLSVSSWTDWVVVASLKNGRERGIRGASDGVKLAVQDSLRALRTSRASVDTRKIGKRPKVRIEGLDVAEPQWCLVDGGRVVVHVMTEAARANWEVERVAIENIAAKGVSQE